MLFSNFRRLISAFCLLPLAITAYADKDSRYRVTHLVSDIAGMAPLIDPNLRNPWGIGLNSAGAAFWVSNQLTGVSTLYVGDVNGSPFTKVPLTVTIPGGNPTGQVFNGTSSFRVNNGTTSGPGLFITAGLSGIIAGWNPAVAPNTTAKLGIAVNGAVYTGLAIGNDGVRNLLYAANPVQGTVDVFDSNYMPTAVPGMFADPNLTPGLRPFNVQAVQGHLFVTYTNRAMGDVEGNGAVNEFDMNGHLIRRFTDTDSLVQPWGVTLAPSNFGSFSGALLVGNFGDGRIHAFRMSDGKKLGALKRNHGGPIELERLWDLKFGNGVTAGNRNDLYFTAGIGDEEHGLFGKIEVDE
jgi:uncharacterized protein (TIGR03118 family)